MTQIHFIQTTGTLQEHEAEVQSYLNFIQEEDGYSKETTFIDTDMVVHRENNKVVECTYFTTIQW